MRLRLLVPLDRRGVALGLAPAAAADPAARRRTRTGSPRRRDEAGHRSPSASSRCDPVPSWRTPDCGHIERSWEPGNPSAGQGPRRLRLRAGARPQPARARHVRPARGRARLLDHRHRLVVRRDVRAAAPATQPPAGRPARHGTVRALDCPDLQNLKIAYSVAAGRCGRSLGSPQRRLHQRPIRRRPRGRDQAARPRQGRPVRRLLRHVLRPGVRRPPRRPAAQHRARQRLPDVRRDRVVPDPGAGHALVVRQGVPALAGVPRARAGLRARDAARAPRRTPAPVARRLARRRRPADEGHGRTPRRWPRPRSARRTARTLPRAHRRAPVRAAR